MGTADGSRIRDLLIRRGWKTMPRADGSATGGWPADGGGPRRPGRGRILLLLLRQEENDERPRGWRPADARRAAGKSGSTDGGARREDGLLL